MSDQIDNEYQRLLSSYRDALEKIAALGPIEMRALNSASIAGERFRVRHAISDAAQIIIDTETKLKVFDNFTWSR